MQASPDLARTTMRSMAQLHHALCIMLPSGMQRTFGQQPACAAHHACEPEESIPTAACIPVRMMYFYDAAPDRRALVVLLNHAGSSCLSTLCSLPAAACTLMPCSGVSAGCKAAHSWVSGHIKAVIMLRTVLAAQHCCMYTASAR
jgi:hypothetical protein